MISPYEIDNSALENSSVKKDPDKDRENNFSDVVEDQFDFEFFDLILEFSSFRRFERRIRFQPSLR